jgi:hypothetical protein
MNKVTGTLAKQMAGMKIHEYSRNIIKIVAENAIIMVAMEKKRVKRPIIIFDGNDFRKSSSK